MINLVAFLPYCLTGPVKLYDLKMPYGHRKDIRPQAIADKKPSRCCSLRVPRTAIQSYLLEDGQAR
jgi:hypothetical protein